MTRDEAKAAVACPKCGARAGSPCVQSGRAVRIHPARLMAAETLGWRAADPISPAWKAASEGWRRKRYERKR